MIYDPAVTEHRGPYGVATKVQIDSTVRNASESLAYYLITAPAFHPFWSQYILTTIRLRQVPDLPPPVLRFDGATHELMVVAVNPEPEPWTVERLVATGFKIGILSPVNILHQYEATDDEMTHLSDLCAQGIVHGILSPESGDAPTRIREQWLAMTVKTLAHIRGEEHAP